MSARTELQLYGGRRPYRVIVEPWAGEFWINPGDQCVVAAVHDYNPPSLGLEHHPDYLIVWINESGTSFEFWRCGKREC